MRWCSHWLYIISICSKLLALASCHKCISCVSYISFVLSLLALLLLLLLLPVLDVWWWAHVIWLLVGVDGFVFFLCVYEVLTCVSHQARFSAYVSVHIKGTIVLRFSMHTNSLRSTHAHTDTKPMPCPCGCHAQSTKPHTDTFTQFYKDHQHLL